MSCSVHQAMLRRSRRKVVSVNGVVDPARRDRPRGAAPSGAARRSRPGQAAARALAVRELLLQEARRLGIEAEPLTRRRGAPRDRRGGLDPRAGRARGAHAARRTRRPAGATTSRTGSASARRTSTRPRISCSRRGQADAQAYAQARAAAEAALAMLARASGAVRRTGAGAFRLPVGGAGRQSRPDHRRADDAGVRAGACSRWRPGSDRAGAGRDALRPSHHPARSQDRRPRAAVRAGRGPHRRLSARKRAAARDGAIYRAARRAPRRSRASISQAPKPCGSTERSKPCCLVT